MARATAYAAPRTAPQTATATPRPDQPFRGSPRVVRSANRALRAASASRSSWLMRCAASSAHNDQCVTPHLLRL